MVAEGTAAEDFWNHNREGVSHFSSTALSNLGSAAGFKLRTIEISRPTVAFTNYSEVAAPIFDVFCMR